MPPLMVSLSNHMSGQGHSAAAHHALRQAQCELVSFWAAPGKRAGTGLMITNDSLPSRVLINGLGLSVDCVGSGEMARLSGS